MNIYARCMAMLVLIFFIIPAIAQDLKSASPIPDVSSKNSSIVYSDSLNAANQQIKLLESQLEMTREYQSLLLSTVYWALGGVFVLVGLLLGFGWLANFKIYERDKESLRSEMLSELSKVSADIASSFLAQSSALEQGLNAKSEAATEALSKLLDSNIDKVLKPMRYEFVGVEQRVFSLELLRRKAVMDAEPSDSMALTAALRCLEVCRTRAEDEIPDIIKFMLVKLDRGGRFTAKEITQVNAFIDMLPAQYKALTDRLRAKLVASDIH